MTFQAFQLEARRGESFFVVRLILRDIKLLVPEALYDDLSALARLDRRALSECIRVTLEQHVYSTISVYQG